MRFPLLPLLSSLLLLLPFTHAALDDQMVLPGSGSGPGPYTPQTNARPTLADLLTIEPAASIFYSYARETPLSALFADEAVRVTLLVPTNRAVMALARKPHQGPAPVREGVILPEEEFDAWSKTNVERWVSAHIIPRSPISLTSPSPATHATMLEGKNVTFTPFSADESAPEWAHVRMDGDVPLIGMKEALNGVIYMLEGTVRLD